MIELFTAGTPNGYKVSITLEELGLPYEVRALNLGDLEQKQPWFLSINPNGRIPAIIDHDTGAFPVFESGAIMVYLAEKTGRLMPTDTKGRSLVLQWLMFQMGGVGPMMGQANVFHRYLPQRIELAITRYQSEVRRLFGVIDQRLSGHEFLAGDYSIADIATFAWVRTHDWSGVPVEDLRHLNRWLDTISARPATQRGLLRPPSQRTATTQEKHEAEKSFVSMARKIVQTSSDVR